MELHTLPYVVVDVDETLTGLTRDDLHRALWAENVLARRYFYPGCHRAEPYRTLRAPESWHLTHTERLCARVLTLPTGSSVELDDIRRIGAIVEVCVREAPRLRKNMVRS